jgi:hypothetical protein
LNALPQRIATAIDAQRHWVILDTDFIRWILFFYFLLASQRLSRVRHGNVSHRRVAFSTGDASGNRPVKTNGYGSNHHECPTIEPVLIARRSIFEIAYGPNLMGQSCASSSAANVCSGRRASRVRRAV